MDKLVCHFEQLWLPPAERDPVTMTYLPPLVPVKTGNKPRIGADPDGFSERDTAQAHALVAAVAKSGVEALTGYRPINQLMRWLEPDAINGLLMAERHGQWRNASIHKVQAKVVSESSIEGVAHIAVGARRVAFAIRLTLYENAWICTDLSVMLPGSHLQTAV